MLLSRATFWITWFLLFVCFLFPLTIQAQKQTSSDTSALLAVNGGKAVQYLNGTFIVSDVLTNEKVSAIKGIHQQAPYFCGISDNGRWLLYSIKTKTEKDTYVHDLTSNGELKQVLPFALESAAFTSDGSKVFFIHSKTFWKSHLAAYDTEHWQLLAMRTVADLTNSIAVNADGSTLLTAARSIVKEIDPQTLKTQKVHWETSRLTDLVYSPTDPHQFASINHKNIIEVRNLLQDRVTHTIRAGAGKIEQVVYTPDGRRLISLDDAGNLAAWNLNDSLKQISLEGVQAFGGFDGRRLRVLKEDWLAIDYGAVKTGSNNLEGAQPDTAFLTGSTRKVGMVPIPIIDYSPENNLLLGFGMSFVFNNHDEAPSPSQPFFRPSVLTPSISFGFKGQLQAGLKADYFSERGWHFFNQVGFLRNNRSYFFGLGRGADDEHRTLYRNNIFSWEGGLTKAIGQRFFAGMKYHIRNDSQLDFDESAPIAVPNSNGGFLAGVGPVLRLDSRNDLFFPTGGYYVDMSFTHYGKWLGSDYGYNDLRFDYRGFHSLPILTTGTTLAVQALYHATFNGDAPFYQLPYLSADRILRGVWRNLYIDKQAVALQTELRSNFSNIDPRYGYVLFAGAGDVAPNLFKGYNPDITGVFGVGLRQQVTPKLKLQSSVDFSVTTKGDIGIFGGMGLTF
ncbi:BamA/TamA family outer membrane protein [Olivibacter sp. SDN3]|uniref:BamA/TamA family outer membrane protein n=1 Tax=Olivibacter sp. SDN3 TaxID=2764720 RepID=UPI0016518EA7|nr:BamA/TamA family outer membrane protein [Olivibacter sp. SDN3]QNL48069.1 BamA/TamA family outer membrane protein [Olivibacter sp. SDN3]